MQEMSRGYAQAPDIMTQVCHVLRLDNSALPFEGKVRVLVTFGASGGSAFLTRYVNFHHKAGMLPDGRPPFNGYFIEVGMLPKTRPEGAVLVSVVGENEIITNLQMRGPDPDDTDNPRFRIYQIPGTGHVMSAPLPGMPINRNVPDGLHYYDKQNNPILWNIWQSMFDWIEHDKLMPRAPRVKLDNKAPDGIARDQYGNAVGGLRTPWLDVPDGSYIRRAAKEAPMSLFGAYRPFTEEKMRQLYGSARHYVELVNRRVDRMVRDGWVMAQDADLMKLHS